MLSDLIFDTHFFQDPRVWKAVPGIPIHQLASNQQWTCIVHTLEHTAVNGFIIMQLIIVFLIKLYIQWNPA